MSNTDLNKELTAFIHDLFVLRDYQPWVKNLENYSFGAWTSLIVELDKAGCPLSTVKSFGEDCFSKFVFCRIKSPTYDQSNETMMLFSVSGWVWHSAIWHTTVNAGSS